MTTVEWTTVGTVAGSTRIELAMPPGWWHIDPNDHIADVVRVAETTAGSLPPDSPVRSELTAELGRLARVSAASGVLLMASGAAVDEQTRKIATASLMVILHETYLHLDHSAHEQGPDATFALPAGQALRHLWLGRSETKLGRILMLEVDYVIAPPQPPSWVLVFQTPALERRGELVEVFDAVAQTVRISRASVTDLAGAFG